MMRRRSLGFKFYTKDSGVTVADPKMYKALDGDMLIAAALLIDGFVSSVEDSAHARNADPEELSQLTKNAKMIYHMGQIINRYDLKKGPT